jgi:two-component system chemotaxis response regulator CheY
MNKRILIVDDSESIRSLLKFNLESNGYETETASDGYEALKALDEEGKDFQLILTDLHMPNMNGLELIERIRTDENHRFLPILFLTTETNPEMKQRARKAGATGWIVKPFAPEQLIKTVRKVLR